MKVSESTIARWIRQGVIPVYKIDFQHYFKRDEFLAWARYKQITPEDSDQIMSEPAVTEPEELDLIKAISLGGIHYRIAGNNMEQVFENIIAVALAPQSQEYPRFHERQDRLLTSLLERERLASTGVGSGIAFPHPRKPMDWGLPHPLVAVIFLEDEIDFNSVDGEPVKLLFLVLCSSVKGHLKMLSLISSVIQKGDMKSFLLRSPAPHPEEIVSKIERLQKEA